MNTTAAVDQMLAAIAEAEHLWPYNDHLIEDEYFCEAVRECANGRDRDELDAVLHPDTGPRFVSGESTTEGYRSMHAVVQPLRSDVEVECDRCLHYERHVTVREDTMSVLGILAAPSVIYFRVCVRCHLELAHRYKNIHWGLKTNGQV